MDIIDKINTQMYNHDEVRDMEVLIEMAMLIDNNTVINEAFDIGMFKTGVKSLMKGIGIHGHKTGDGLIQVALKSGKTLAEFIWHSMKAAGGNEESKERVKQMANKEIKKEQVIDFLLKLDMATLHMVSGPLHIIDALTGWHIWANIKTHSQDSIKKAKDAIRNLIDAAKGARDEIKNKLKNLMKGIARLFGFEDEAKIIERV